MISARLPSCESPFKFASATLFIYWLFETQLAKAHTALAAAFLLHHAMIGKDAVHKYGTLFQLRSEFFCIRMVFLSIERGAINAARLWKWR